MIHYVNYSNDKFKRSRILANLCAKYLGKVDVVHSYTPGDIDPDFLNSNKNILSIHKGGGLWLWKPYFVKKVLDSINYGDWLVYVDSGSLLIRNIKQILESNSADLDDVIGFELPLREWQWTKSRLFEFYNVDETIKNTNQIMATLFMIRKTKKSESFINEYLEMCRISYLIDDTVDKERDYRLIEHRHDQSIFSILFKTYGFNPCMDVSQRNNFSKSYVTSGREIIKQRNELYITCDGLYFEKRDTLRTLAREPLVLMHKSTRPIRYIVRFCLKKLINYDAKYKL